MENIALSEVTVTLVKNAIRWEELDKEMKEAIRSTPRYSQEVADGLSEEAAERYMDWVLCKDDSLELLVHNFDNSMISSSSAISASKSYDFDSVSFLLQKHAEGILPSEKDLKQFGEHQLKTWSDVAEYLKECYWMSSPQSGERLSETSFDD